MLLNSNNRFLDRVLVGLAHEQSVTDSIVNVVWRGSEEPKYGLIRFSPRSEENLGDLKDLLVDSLERLAEDETFKFKCSGTLVVDEAGCRNMILKVWESE